MRILLGLSGGVDSAYSVVKLQDEGHTVEAAFLDMHDYSEYERAKLAANKLGIPLHVINCKDAFDKIVKENFISEYLNARTPNPCIICNEQVKFVYLYNAAMEMGFDAIATGHYSRIVVGRADKGFRGYIAGDYIGDGERVTIAKADDPAKDQSYMLYRVPEYILRALILPLSEVCKEDIKLKADALGLVPKDTKESQEICFIGNGNYADFIENRHGIVERGNFIAPDGSILGRHEGIIRYTIGQRKGLGLSGGARIFVTAIDPVTNNITLSYEDKLYGMVKISSLINLGYDSLPEASKLSVKLRYGAKPVMCRCTISGNTAILELATPVRAVTPGQSAVLYFDDNVVLGGYIDFAE